MGAVVSGAAKNMLPCKPEFDKGNVTCEDVRKAIANARSGSFKNQRKAAVCLCGMAKVSESVRDQIVEEGGILPILSLMQSKSAEIQENCLLALSELCTSQKSRPIAFQCQAWAPMLLGLESKQSSVQDAAAVALCNLADLEEAQFKLVHEGAVPWLLKIISETSNDETGMHALKTLLKCSEQPDNLFRMVNEGALEPMYQAVHSAVKPQEFRVCAMHIFARLCATSESHERIRRINGGTGLQRLVALVATHDDDLRSYAAAAVARLACSPSLARKMVSAGVLPSLKKMLKVKDLSDPSLALSALASLTALASAAEEHRKMIGRAGHIPAVLRLCTVGHGDVELAAVGLLAALAVNRENRALVVSSGGYRLLELCARSGGAAESRSAAQAVLNDMSGLIETKRETAVRKAIMRFKALPLTPTSSKGQETVQQSECLSG